MKAIQTKYKGYLMRSRLEARWAVFFDTLGVKWEYEAEGYDLGKDGWYLPDFRLHMPNGSILFAEVKPEHQDDFEGDHLRKCRALADATDCPVVLLSGVPEYRIFNAIGPHMESDSFMGCLWTDWPGELGYLHIADDYWFQQVELDPATGRLYFPFDERRRVKAFGKRLVSAVDAARSARFEHGEMPR